jgi:hypothetical protein
MCTFRRCELFEQRDKAMGVEFQGAESTDFWELGSFEEGHPQTELSRNHVFAPSTLSVQGGIPAPSQIITGIPIIASCRDVGLRSYVQENEKLLLKFWSIIVP